MKCKKCGNNNPVNREYCTTCGSKLPVSAQKRKAAEAKALPEATPPVAEPPADAQGGSPDTPKKKAGRGRKGFICTQCDRAFEPGESFCRNCGASIDTARPARSAKQRLSARAARVGIFLALFILADSAILLRRGFYNIAIERLDEGRYTDAYEVFSLLGGFEDSEMYAAECYRYVSYQEGARLFQSGEHAKAREIFAELGDFRDSADMLEACDNYIRYNRALELYAEEKYGQAHAIFAELGNFEDSAERMAKCVRPAPQNGIVEKGPAYVGGQAEFAIHNNKSKDMCFGIRDADGGDWGLIYVRAGEKAIVKIPPGEYSMSAGIGDNWFGAIDLFGLQTVDGVQYVETTLVDGRPSFAVPAAGYDYYTSF